MRVLWTLGLLLWLPGCLAHRDLPREWLVYVREVPVARVTVPGASHGNVVDVTVRGANVPPTNNCAVRTIRGSRGCDSRFESEIGDRKDDASGM